MPRRKRALGKPLRQRVIALLAAYAVALASLIAGFGTARAAAALALDSGAVICHAAVDGASAPSPASDHTNDRTCIDCCSSGCLMLLAALPPPPVNAVAAPLSAPRRVAPLVPIALERSAEANSHLSRAPPSNV